MEHGAAAFLTLVWFVGMGAAQSMDAARPCNNQDAVKALLLYHHHLALQKSPAKDQRATCPVPHGPRGADARRARPGRHRASAPAVAAGVSAGGGVSAGLPAAGVLLPHCLAARARRAPFQSQLPALFSVVFIGIDGAGAAQRPRRAVGLARATQRICPHPQNRRPARRPPLPQRRPRRASAARRLAGGVLYRGHRGGPARARPLRRRALSRPVFRSRWVRSSIPRFRVHGRRMRPARHCRWTTCPGYVPAPFRPKIAHPRTPPRARTSRCRMSATVEYSGEHAARRPGPERRRRGA